MKKKKTKKITIKKVWLFQLGNQVEEIGEYELGYPLEKKWYPCTTWIKFHVHLSFVAKYNNIMDTNFGLNAATKLRDACSLEENLG